MTTATLSKTLLTSIPPQLVPMLKTLRLGGMQDTLPLRLDQAQQQRLGYLEFLELLLGDEIERRANRALASRLSKAHFEDSDKTFENFDWTFNPKLPQEQLRDLATGGYLISCVRSTFCCVVRRESAKRIWPKVLATRQLGRATGSSSSRPAGC
jgi:IstB-like ATP binding protein